MDTFKWLMIWAIVATVCLTIYLCVLHWPHQYVTVDYTLHEGAPVQKQSFTAQCKELYMQQRCREYGV